MQFTPSMLPCIVHIHHAKLRISATSVAASPRLAFMKHADEHGITTFTVRFRELRPQSVAVINGDELVFQSVSDQDKPVLLETLSSIIRFHHRMRSMLNDLCREVPPHAAVDTNGDAYDMLQVSIPRGNIYINHENDLVGVYAESSTNVFDSRIRLEHGPIIENGAETGVLSYCGENFPGADLDQEEIAGFSFTFPEEEAQIRQLFSALAGILFSSAGPRA